MPTHNGLKGAAAACAAATAGALWGCTGGEPIRMEGAFRLDGPIEVRMSGPRLRYEGVFVSEGLFEQVRAGETTAGWVLAAFGDPERVLAAEGGGEYWVWNYRVMDIEGAAVELIGGGDEEGRIPTHITTILLVTDGLVIAKWRG